MLTLSNKIDDQKRFFSNFIYSKKKKEEEEISKCLFVMNNDDLHTYKIF
jgi:hypothetical protein